MAHTTKTRHLCLIVALLTIPNLSTSGSTVIYVDSKTGTDNSSCLNSNSPPLVACRTLSYALSGISSSGLDSTSLLVSSGEYSLLDQIQFNKTKDLLISGQGVDSTVVTCSGAASAKGGGEGGGGIEFIGCENVSISGATFTGCGLDKFIESVLDADDDNSASVMQPATTTTAALSFDSCKDVSISNVRVTQSFSLAVAFDSCAGMLALKNSIFTDNNKNKSVANCSNGGAVSVTLVNNGIFKIESCIFTGNYASTGGAVYTEISQSASNSHVLVKDSFFGGNIALTCDANEEQFLDGTGGALSLFISSPSQDSLNNSITISNSNFTRNIAISGAGVHYHIWNARSKVQQHLPMLSIMRSVFDSNKGNMGAAVVMSPVKVNMEAGFLHWVCFEGNIFIDNSVQLNGIHAGIGTVFTRSINVQLTGMHEFLGNQGSAIVALNAVLQFQEISETRFIGNIGFNGGALQLYGESVLLISSNASLVFINNLATGRGGAIYHSTHDTFQRLPRECFLQYADATSGEIIHGAVTFRDNRVRNKTNAIYSNALSDCIAKTDEAVIFCQNNWVYVFSNCSESVDSEPVGFVFSNLTDRFNLFSGVRTVLPITITNVFGINLTEDVTLSASTDELNEVFTNPSSGLISNSTIELNGKENTSNNLYLQTSNLPFVGVDVLYHIKQCPPGFLPTPEDSIGSNRCTCVENSYAQGAIICKNEALVSELVITHCMSEYGKNDSRLVVGSCEFLFGSTTMGSIQLPQDPAEVEGMICGRMDRQGILCGKCKDGYAVTAFSYLFTCAKCDNKMTSWIVYIAFQYLPIVMLFFLITILNLSIISPASNAFLFISQVSTLSNAYVYTSFITRYAIGETKGTIIVNLYNTIYGVWNLDFFRAFAPPICLFEEQNALYVTFMEFVAAFFPFALVLLTYFFLALHNKNFRVLVWIWRPIKNCLNKVHATFKTRTSLVDVFVTFFIFSYLKIVAITFRFLQYVFVYDIKGEILDVVYFYDGNIKVFQGIHLPFGILAIVTIFTIVLFPPLLLTCYQFRWFQRILEKLHLRTQALITFVEVIQSGFTDGRDGTKDRRFFAGFYLILRIVIFGPTTVVSVVFIRTLVPLLAYTIGIIALVVFQPYQNSFYNKLDVLLLLNILFSSFITILALTLALSGAPPSATSPLLYLSYFLAFLPLVYMTVHVIRWVLITTNIHKGKCLKLLKGNNSKEALVTVNKRLFSVSNYSIPDRIIQPELYQSLIVTPPDQMTTNKSNKSTIRGDTTNNRRQSNSTGDQRFSLNRTYELSTYQSQ